MTVPWGVDLTDTGAGNTHSVTRVVKGGGGKKEFKWQGRQKTHTCIDSDIFLVLWWRL